MIKKILTLTLAALLAIPIATPLFVVPVWAQETAAAPAQEWTKQTYAAIDKSILAKDYASLIAWQSADYTAVDAKGQVKTREVANAELKKFLDEIPGLQSVQTTVEKVENAPDGALKTTVLMSIKAHIKGQGEKPIVLEIKGRSSDLWTPNADKTAYQMKVSAELETVMTADGFPIPLG